MWTNLSLGAQLILLPFVLATAPDVSLNEPLNTENSTSLIARAKLFAYSIINEHYEVQFADSSDAPKGLFLSKPEGVKTSELLEWSSAPIWDAMIAYANLTGDAQYNDVVSEALYAQLGDTNYNAFMPANRSQRVVSQVQSQWALAALSAAELGLPKPNNNKPSYLTIAQNVFDMQVESWDEDTACSGGGLRDGFSDGSEDFWLSAFATSNFFQLSARLVKLTSNETYNLWAEKAFTQAQELGFISEQYEISDWVYTGENNDICQLESTYMTSVLGNWIEGVAVLYNSTNGNATWRDHLSSLVDTATNVPFTIRTGSGFIISKDCNTDPGDTCGVNRTLQYVRSLSRSVALAPFTSEALTPLLKDTAKAIKCGKTSITASGGKSYEYSAACPGSWATESSTSMSIFNDADAGSVASVTAAMESIQGLLWGMEGDNDPSQTQGGPNPSATKGVASGVRGYWEITIAVGATVALGIALG